MGKQSMNHAHSELKFVGLPGTSEQQRWLTRLVVAALGQQVVQAEAVGADGAAGVDAGVGVAARLLRPVAGRRGRQGREQRAVGAARQRSGQADALGLDVAEGDAVVGQLNTTQACQKLSIPTKQHPAALCMSCRAKPHLCGTPGEQFLPVPAGSELMFM